MQCAKLKTYMETGRVIFVPARSIRPNPTQPRRIFDEEALQELSDSIAQHGILQPLSVRRADGGYELIAGERRLRAAMKAGLSEIPCIVMRMDEKESGIAALVENLQRRDLDYIEEARGLSRLMQLCSLSQEQVARMVGKSQSSVANKLRLLRHSDVVLKALRAYNLTERHARALLRLPSEEQKMQVLQKAATLGFSVARLESYVEEILSENSEKSPQKANIGLFLNNLNQSLSRIQRSGVSAISERRETDKQIIFTITIPKE